MSSTTVTTTAMSFGLRSITTLGRTNPWPDPILSIGECWCSLGANRCWEPIGPAKDKFEEISHQIKSLLESRWEYLSEGVCVRRLLIFELYMIGRTAELAKPTIIFSSENKTQRQRAKKLVRESGILSGCPGIGLGESSRPLRLSRSPVPLGEQPISLDDIEMSIHAGSSSVPDASVWYSSPLSGMRCIPITIKREQTEALLSVRKSMLGVICIGNELLGLTVAHAFFDDPDNEITIESDLEFSLDDEDHDGDAFEYSEEFIDMTSHGSVSPEQWTQESLVALEELPWSGTELEIPSRDGLNSNGKNKIENFEAPAKYLGRVSAISQQTATENLDWALVRIDCIDFRSSFCAGLETPRTRHVVASLDAATTVHVITGSSGCVVGSITRSSTFMQHPESTVFQEVWTVKLDGRLQSGDSGSWVIDPISGGLYGYVIAGDPQTSIAYIIPAYQVFPAMEQQFGCKVTFPSEGYLFNVRDTAVHADDHMDCTAVSFDSSSDIWSPPEDENADYDPYPGNDVRRRITWWSSRPTTPSESSAELNEVNFPTPIIQLRESVLTLGERTGDLSFPSRQLRKERQPVPGSFDKPDDIWVSTPLIPASHIENKALDHSTHRHMQSFQPSAVPGHEQPVQMILNPLSISREKTVARGRQRNLIREEKKSALEVRDAKACWACHISKTKCSPCSPGSPCEQCARLAGKRRICLFSCFNDPLEALTPFLLPEHLFGNFNRANIEPFIIKNVSGWGKTIMHINLLWGMRRPIDADVVSLELRDNSQLPSIHKAMSFDLGERQFLRPFPLRRTSPSLGIPLELVGSMERKYEKYIQDVVKDNLDEYVDIMYDTEESLFPERLFRLICSFLGASRGSDQDYQILRGAVEMHVIFTILERSLIIDSESLKLVEEELQEHFSSRVSPRGAELQIRSAFIGLCPLRAAALLKELGKLLWTTPSKKQTPEIWATSFCLLSLLTLAIDKNSIRTRWYCEGGIENYGLDPIAERAALKQQITLTERELFERSKEIFHWKFKTRKAGKESFNPIRDGVEAFESFLAPEPRTVNLVMGLQGVVQKFEPQIRAGHSQIPQDGDRKSHPYTDSGRLTRIFLNEFLGH